MTPLSRKTRPILAAALAAIALFAVLPAAEAHKGGRWRGDVDVHIGVPFWGYWGPRWYYAPPPVVYAPPPAVYVPRADVAPVYVERDDDEAQPQARPQAPVWWYWCPSERGYHPYVKECPGGWQRVPPQAVQ